MARYANDSSDDDFSDNLHLAERLRIHRENKGNYSRKKNILDDQSSSSSSIEMQNEVRRNTSSRSYNKKRQNGDKNAELLANPKRTCLRNRTLKSPDIKNKEKPRAEYYRHSDLLGDSSDSSNKHIFADRTYEDHIHNLTKEVPAFNRHTSKQHLKRKIPNGLSERMKEDSTGVKPKQRDFPKQSSERNKIIKNLFPAPNSHEQYLWREPHNNLGEHSRSATNGVMKSSPFVKPQDADFSPSGSGIGNLVDSASDEDSRSMLNSGALKGGRQSPVKVVYHRIINKVLDTDESERDSDNEDVSPKNRSKFRLIFSSSDSEVESTRKEVTKPQAVPDKTTNSLSTNGDNFEMINNFPPPCFPRDTSLPGPSSSPVSSSPDLYSHSTRSLRNFKERSPIKMSVSNFHSNNLSRAVRSRGRMNVGERYTRGSGSPHHRTLPQPRMPNGPHRTIPGPRTPDGPPPHRTIPGPRTPPRMNRADALKSSKGRSLTGCRSRRGNLNLASTYPDLFDAEDSSEVEFFTANSYSDTETSAESLGGLTISSTVRGPVNNGIICEHSINIGSSEDEISVVFSTGPVNDGSRMTNQTTRNGETRRALGRRRQRGSFRPIREIVSLSPDPVEQVEQVENDERYARMLQAQFDSEVDADYSPPQPPHSASNPHLYGMVASLDTLNTRARRVNDCLWGQDEPHSPVRNFPDFSAFEHSYPPSAFGLYPSRLADRNRGRRRGTSNESRNFQRLMEAGLFAPFDHLFNSNDDNFETFLGIADLNGDVPRGLQKNEINRLPTRKFIVANSNEGSSSELPHKRAGLNKECQVCLNDYVNGDTLRILPCFHEFHTPCIDPWLKINHTCPVCRVVVDLEG